MIAVTSLKQGFNRVVRRGVGYVSAPGQISSFPLLGEQIVLRAESIVSGQCCEQYVLRTVKSEQADWA